MFDFIRHHVLPRYGLNDEAVVSSLGNGHINHTFLVSSTHRTFVLQKINTHVFPNPEKLVNNSVRIAAHLQHKKQQGHYRLRVVSPVLTLDGDSFIDLQQHGFWRAMDYITDNVVIEGVNTLEQASMAASGFAHFAAGLSDINPNEIEAVIPAFFSLPLRFEQLKQAVADDKFKRLDNCLRWVDFVLAQASIMTEVAKAEAQLPRRACHNDTKINNILFDKHDGSALAVIDLDTCMLGYLMYDFGDMVRAFCSPEAEDSTALDNVVARKEIIACAAQHYLSDLEGIITPLEKRSLWLGLKVMPLMLGCRFLTDHLNGDAYFKAKHVDHNLDRAANQLTIYQSLLAQQTTLMRLFE